jgi:hypothetical protein
VFFAIGELGIDLIRDDIEVVFLNDFGDRLQVLFLHDRPGWVMGIVKDDELARRGDGLFEVFRLRRKAFFS